MTSMSGSRGLVKTKVKIEVIPLLKKGVWLYFFLLVFEGALRKWLLPGLATPLLLVRDPLALWLIYTTWKNGLLPSNFYLTIAVLISIISVFSATLLGHGNLFVALFGARILLIHFPLIFVIGRVFDYSDVVALGRVMLWLSIPMVILIAAQFFSPQSAWVNRGVGGDMEGAGFDGALGYYRPPGTFSFTNGNTLFFSFLAPFILFFWLSKKKTSVLLLAVASVAFLSAIPLSISRALLFQTIISLLFVLVATSGSTKFFGRMLVVSIGCVVAILVLSETSFFGTATEAFSARFDSANKIEGGVEGVFLDRFLGGLIGALTNSTNLPFWGYGVGLGTNVGSVLHSGNRVFLIAEEEWGRLVGELGLLMGVTIILLRLGLVFKFVAICYKYLRRGKTLPWMLLSFGLLNIAQGNWAQPTSLGFSILIAGLIVSSLRNSESDI
jgi:hypothetical protein